MLLKIAHMIMKQSQKRNAAEHEELNAEIKQYYQMYNLFNVKGHLDPLLNRQETSSCSACQKNYIFHGYSDKNIHFPHINIPQVHLR